MKKSLLLLFLLLISTAGFAQKLRWGVKGGMNFSTLTHADLTQSAIKQAQNPSPEPGRDWSVDPKTKHGFHIGLFVELPIRNSPRFTLQPEAVYSRQGARYKNLLESSGVEKGEIRIDYLNIPFIFKYNPIGNLFIELGPQISFALHSSEKETINGKEQTNPVHFFIRHKTIDLGASMGLSYRFFQKVDLSARYSVGTIHIFKETEATIKNRNAQVSVGYRF